MPGERDFVHLHLHTEYSLLDGASRAGAVAQRAAQWEMPAVALTDHGNLYGAIPFYQACQEHGVKPILGVEAYVVNEGTRADRTRSGRDGSKNLCHFTLLAENETGWRNLLKIVSDSWLHGFYYKPRMDHDLLAEHHEGLIAMSACLGGEIPQALLNGQPQRAVDTALLYRDIFGPENFFLELMDHHTAEQTQVNDGILEIHRATGIPLIASNDVHYVEQTDAEPQDLLLCVQTGCLRSDPNRMQMSSRELWFRSGQQMWDLFGDYPQALLNTVAVAERCNLKLKFGDLILPDYPVPEGETAGSYLRKLCLERVGRFYSPVTPEVLQRLDYELKIIEDKGYSPYYLIVWDLIDYAKRSGIRVGPGRGSGAGSLAAYVLGITELDPLRFALFFERFLNPERPSPPDFDIDFPPERREEVVAYTIQKYGPTHTAKIITFGTLGARAAIKDVGRVLQMPIEAVNELSGLVPDRPGTHLAEALEQVEELRRRYETDAVVHEVVDAALHLEGLSRHTSVHAAALVIARDELSNYVPLCKVSGGEDIVTQFDMGAVDKIGLLKMDFLGLRTMTVIDEACRLIRENHGIAGFDVRTLGFDDQRTYELISRGDVVGVFQLESGGFQRVCRDLRPDCIEDIVALVALYRPGPMDNIPEFIARKHGEKRVQYKHPLLESILDNTYGIIVYQEQVMQIGRDLAGFSLGEADQIRKAVGKKDAAVMAKVREKFIAGCETNGIAAGVANDLMNEIEQFASYAFNKAHSACYAVIAYWTAYLKANYPHEFMAAQLTSVMDNRDKVVTFVQDTRGMGIDVLPPCVNTGGARFEVHESHIVYGMAAINGIGVKVAEAIVAECAAAGAYTDLYDLCRRVDPQALPKAAVEKLVRAGACRAFGNRRQLLDGYELIYEAAQRARADERSGQQSLFADMEEELGADVRAPRLKPISEFNRDQLRDHDVELLGLVLFENPYGDLNAKLAEVELPLTRIDDLRDLAPESAVVLGGLLEETFPITTKKGQPMLRARLNDGRGSVSLVLFPRTYEKFADETVQGRVVLVIGKTEANDGRGSASASVIVEKVLPTEEWRKARRAAEQQPAKAAPRGGNGRTNGHANGDETPAEPAGPALTDLAAVDVRVRVGQRFPERLGALAQTLREHPGEVPVVLWLEDDADHRRLKLAQDFATTWSEALAQAVERIGGCSIRPVE